MGRKGCSGSGGTGRRLQSPTTVLQTGTALIQLSVPSNLPSYLPSLSSWMRVPPFAVLRRANNSLQNTFLGPWLLFPPRRLQSFSPSASPAHSSNPNNSSQELRSALLSRDLVQYLTSPVPALCLCLHLLEAAAAAAARTARRHRRPTEKPRDGQALAQFILNRCSDCSQPCRPSRVTIFGSPPSLSPSPIIRPSFWSDFVIWPFLTLWAPPSYFQRFAPGVVRNPQPPRVEDGETHQSLAAIQDRKRHARPIFCCR